MVMDKFAMLYLWLNMKWMIKKFILLFCLMLLLPVSASAAFKGLHPPMEIEPELLAPPPIEGMVFVKGGCYEMGDTFDRPVHTVCVDDFYIGKYEMTVGEFREFVNKTGYKTEAEAEADGGCLGVKEG